MKRKKWSEIEEQTLLSKYSELVESGTLAKLKTREKKFKPIADHVNSLHHLQDPITYPFKWTWRDVSIKVQNMRHQYLGVKQKIRISSNEFNWEDGEIHWENFLKYKEVFGDIELSDNVGWQLAGKKFGEESISYILGYGIDCEKLEDEEELDDEEDEDCEVDEELDDEGVGKEGNNEDSCFNRGEKLKQGSKAERLRVLCARVMELRDMTLRREEKRREREWMKEVKEMENEAARKEKEMMIENQLRVTEEGILAKEMEFEEMKLNWAKRESEKWRDLERELREEKRRRMKLEEKLEEEEMEWRERIVEMHIEHEKQMMQMHADASQNQIQIIGVVARLLCQFFGSTNDSLGGSMGTLPPQVLQNLQHPHPGGLGDGGKPDSTLPSEFL